MALFTTLVTSYIWPGIWPSSRDTTIFTTMAIEINPTKSLVDRVFDGHIVCLWKWSLILRLFFDGSRFPLLWIHKIAVFLRSLLNKGLIGYDIILWYDIHVTHTKFLDKFRNLLVLLNIPQTESGVRSILKDESDVPELSRRSAFTKIAAQQSVNETLCQQYWNSGCILVHKDI